MSVNIATLPNPHRTDNDDSAQWRSSALCLYVDPDLFYPEQGDVAAARAAKRICSTCPVTHQCLQDALGRPERFGVWGGKTEHERRRLHRASRQKRRGAA